MSVVFLKLIVLPLFCALHAGHKFYTVRIKQTSHAESGISSSSADIFNDTYKIRVDARVI